MLVDESGKKNKGVKPDVRLLREFLGYIFSLFSHKWSFLCVVTEKRKDIFAYNPQTCIILLSRSFFFASFFDLLVVK